MIVYCSHLSKKFHKGSNFYQCKACTRGWYKNDPTPMIIIGYTEQSEVDAHYKDRFKEKDLSKKKFARCSVCKDLLEKRKHTLCSIKTWGKTLRKRHEDMINSVLAVIKGFKR